MSTRVLSFQDKDRQQENHPSQPLFLSLYRAPRTTFRLAKKSSTQFDKQDMLEFMDEPMETTVGDASSSSSAASVNDLLQVIVEAADGRKAEDIVAMNVRPITTLTSDLVILSGNSRPQNQAIAAAITKAVEEAFAMRPGGNGVPEGTADSGWMLLDYGSVMVHIMTPKSRLYYNVEGQWRDKGGRYYDLSSILIPNKVETGNDDEQELVAKEDDPFWS